MPDGSNKTNVVTVTTSGSIGGRNATAPVNFGNAVITVIDQNVTVNDTYKGPLGNATGGIGAKFNYTRTLNFSNCTNETIQINNTASFVTSTTNTTGNDSWTVLVRVPCLGGCTLTQGYWKTHAGFGAPRFDDAWLLILPSGPNSTFFLSGQTYYQVMQTAPKGNAYYQLAHQYIAATLNALNGASVPPNVQSAINNATTLFNTYTPAQIDALKGNDALRAQFITLAGILGSYNEGGIGPGHCSE